MSIPFWLKNMNVDDFKNTQTIIWYCDFLGYDIDVKIECEDGENLSDYNSIIKMIDSWDSNFFSNLESMLFYYYQDTLIMCGETEPHIISSSEIWKFVRIGSLVLHTNEYKQFVLVSGGCDWEEEHGLEIDINNQNQIVYVGAFIGNGFSEDSSKLSTYNFINGDV